MNLVRTIITSTKEAAIKLFSGTGRYGETFVNRQLMQQYGFTSRPLDGAEGLTLVQGDTIITIATDDKRYRIAIEEGEVAIYTAEGDYIHFKKGNELEIMTPGKLTATAGKEAIIETAKLTADVSESAEITTPKLKANTNEAEITATIKASVVSSGVIDLTAPAINLNTENLGMKPESGVGKATLNGNITINGTLKVSGSATLQAISATAVTADAIITKAVNCKNFLPASSPALEGD